MTEVKSKPNYTLILAYCNNLAKESGFKQAIRPITNWKRPTSQVEIGAWSLTSAGILTAPETCVIANLRMSYTLVAEGARAAVLLVFADMANTLGLETVGEVTEILENTQKRFDLMSEKEIDIELNNHWAEQLAKINGEFDIEAARQLMNEHLVTFIMAMRCDPDWDYTDTAQLTKEEKNAILDFILEEEGAVVEEADEVDEANTPVKKP